MAYDTARNSYKSTRRALHLLKQLARGATFTIQDVQDAYDLGYAQARFVLKLLEDEYNLDTHREGRTKVWSWPPPLRRF